MLKPPAPPLLCWSVKKKMILGVKSIAPFMSFIQSAALLYHSKRFIGRPSENTRALTFRSDSIQIFPNIRSLYSKGLSKSVNREIIVA